MEKAIKMSTPGVKVLDKALFIISVFFEKDELSLKELEEQTKLNRSTIYRILQVFLKWNFLEQDPTTKRYKLSIKILEMSSSVLRKISFLNVCRPFLLGLRDKTGESSFLAVLDGVNIVVVDWEPSYYNAQINITVGKTVPAHCTAAGRAIIASLPPKEREALIGKMVMKKYTENTIIDKDALRQELKDTAERGYAISKGEYDSYIVVVSAPVFDIHNRVIASCAIAALESRVKDDTHIAKYGSLVQKATFEISRKLGSSLNNSVKGIVSY
jgi:IclR family KDG regulon transcriptional repressor